jgi:4-amino-4-deoxy-L-arabinose transferase-like glycosyltransferase
MSVHHALVSMTLIAGLIGLAFVGLALGHALYAGDLLAVARHPLFSSGTAALTAAAVCWLLLMRFSRPRDPP